jgi:hypothetical protein
LKLLNTPDCTMLNRESCDLEHCFGFIRRQLLWTRLYNPSWPFVFVGSVAAYVWVVAGWVLAGAGAFAGSVWSTAVPATTSIAFWVVNLVLIERLHDAVGRRMQRVAGEEPIRMKAAARLRMMFGLAASIVCYTFAVISATLVRRIVWRGIEYDVRPSRGIRMVKYEPYAPPASHMQPNHSL